VISAESLDPLDPDRLTELARAAVRESLADFDVGAG
jgi:hypothetical protein